MLRRNHHHHHHYYYLTIGSLSPKHPPTRVSLNKTETFSPSLSLSLVCNNSFDLFRYANCGDINKLTSPKTYIYIYSLSKGTILMFVSSDAWKLTIINFKVTQRQREFSTTTINFPFLKLKKTHFYLFQRRAIWNFSKNYYAPFVVWSDFLSLLVHLYIGRFLKTKIN